jgi:hypothetical protein
MIMVFYWLYVLISDLGEAYQISRRQTYSTTTKTTKNSLFVILNINNNKYEWNFEKVSKLIQQRTHFFLLLLSTNNNNKYSIVIVWIVYSSFSTHITFNWWVDSRTREYQQSSSFHCVWCFTFHSIDLLRFLLWNWQSHINNVYLNDKWVVFVWIEIEQVWWHFQPLRNDVTSTLCVCVCHIETSQDNSFKQAVNFDIHFIIHTSLDPFHSSSNRFSFWKKYSRFHEVCTESSLFSLFCPHYNVRIQKWKSKVKK